MSPNVAQGLCAACIGLVPWSPAPAMGDDAARQVYCYAFGAREGDKLLRLFTGTTLYVSPIFESDQPHVMLEVAYRQSVPESGLATCVTEEDEPDLEQAWTEFIELTRADGTPVVIAPLPED
jgi:hypothetical protein